MIGPFQGVWRFLSNFWPCSIEWDGRKWTTVEHAYQAAKTVVPEERTMLCEATTPGAAKRLGRKISIRPDWEQVKEQVMLELLRLKFNDNELAIRLARTMPETLVEVNTWGDRYWGMCGSVGENRLGKLLMQVRDEVLAKFRENQQWEP